MCKEIFKTDSTFGTKNCLEYRRYLLFHRVTSIEAILSKMKELVDNVKRFNDDVRFSYDTLSRKVTVHLQNNTDLFFGDVGYVRGFSPKEVISQTSTAEREADLDHGFNDLYNNKQITGG